MSMFTILHAHRCCIQNNCDLITRKLLYCIIEKKIDYDNTVD